MINQAQKIKNISFVKSKSFGFLIFLLLCFFAFYAFAEPSPQDERKALEEELRQLEEKIIQYDADISKTEQEKKTLNNQISILKKKIEQLNLQIYQSNLTIKDLRYQITDTEDSIGKTSSKIENVQADLAGLLQTIYEEDQKPLMELLFSGGTISDFFDNLVALESLNAKTRQFLQEIKGLKVDLEGQKEDLDQEKTGLENVVKIKTLQKKESESVQKQTDYYLKLTETQYQQQLQVKKEAEKKAAEIRARIFELAGVPAAPTFGEALDMAKYASGVTGVRPAFLLAVLTQESNIGKNVGQCYLKNSSTGDGVISASGKTVSRVMKPSRDIPAFLEITQELGRDPYNTPVSCPMSYGYGGAMGPAQFIPSTWMLYKDKVKATTGKAADPWNIKDAFLAAAFYLSNYGAGQQTYNAEWKAAMIYFSGSTNTKYRFYGDSVMKIASQYETDIKQLEGN